MIKNFDKLAERLAGIKINGKDITQESLKEAFEKETELEITPVHIFSDAQLTELKENTKREGYGEGKIAGSEMYAKDLKKLAGIEGTEGKTHDVVFKNISAKLAADLNIEPNKKAKELTDSLEQLQKRYNDDLAKKDSEIKSMNDRILNEEINQQVKSVLSGVKAIKPEYAVLIARQKYGFEFDESKNLLITEKGKVIKDKMEKPRPYNEVLSEFAISEKWMETDGRGGDNSNGGQSGFKTKNELFKYMEDKKIDPVSKEGIHLLDDFEAKMKA